MHLGKRTHFYRIVDNESRLYIGSLTEFSEDFIYQLALSKAFVYAFHLQFGYSYMANFFFCFTIEVKASFFFNCIKNRKTTERSLETNYLIAHLNFWFTVNRYTDSF